MIVNLLQALYDPRVTLPLPSDFAFYIQAKDDIAFFGISSQVYYLLKKQGRLDQTPSFFQKWLKQNYTEALYLNLFVEHQMQQILNLFEEQGIQAIPLKGVFFAERFFGHVGARATSDIDILVQPSALEQAVECVRSLGFTSEEERIPSHFHWSFSKILPHSPIPLTVELHWDFMNKDTSDVNIEEFWEQATPLGEYLYIKELSDYHTLYMICLHGWRHNLDSMKYFIDILQMIHVLHDKFHYSDLFKDAAFHKTLKRLTRTLAIVYHYFPHLNIIKECPLHKRTRLWWDYKAIRYSNNRSLKHYVNFVYYEFFDFDTVKHGITAFFKWLQLQNASKRAGSFFYKNMMKNG